MTSETQRELRALEDVLTTSALRYKTTPNQENAELARQAQMTYDKHYAAKHGRFPKRKINLDKLDKHLKNNTVPKARKLLELPATLAVDLRSAAKYCTMQQYGKSKIPRVVSQTEIIERALRLYLYGSCTGKTRGERAQEAQHERSEDSEAMSEARRERAEEETEKVEVPTEKELQKL